jgi:hypothetical protein
LKITVSNIFVFKELIKKRSLLINISINEISVDFSVTAFY